MVISLKNFTIIILVKIFSFRDVAITDPGWETLEKIYIVIREHVRYLLHKYWYRYRIILKFSNLF